MHNKLQINEPKLKTGNTCNIDPYFFIKHIKVAIYFNINSDIALQKYSLGKAI